MKVGLNDMCICGSTKKFKKCCLNSTYSYKNICLLVGNGLTIDFINDLQITNLESSLPLSRFKSQVIDYSIFNNIKIIKDELLPLAERYSNHFYAIRDYIINNKMQVNEKRPLYEKEIERFKNIPGSDDEIYKLVREYEDMVGEYENKVVNIKRFLAISYALMQKEIDNQITRRNLYEWKWTKWFEQNLSNISCIISFNYDIVVENTIKFLGNKYKRIGCEEESNSDGITILKPHGSLEFDIGNGDYSLEQVSTLTMVGCEVNDAVYALPKRKWTNGRLQPDIIPPLFRNEQKDLKWVSKCYDHYRKIVNDIDVFIIAGFNYSPADREEVNLLVDLLEDRKIEFYIVNPKIPSELEMYIMQKGHKVIKRNFMPWFVK